MSRLAESWGLVPVADLERAADELERGEHARAADELDRLIDQANEATILLYSEPRPGAIPIEEAYAAEPDPPPPSRAGMGWGERCVYLLLLTILVLNLALPVHQNGTEADLGAAIDGTGSEQTSRCFIEPQIPRYFYASRRARL